MLKLLFWFLLAINIVVFASTRNFTDSSETSMQIQNSDPVRPEKIRFLSSSSNFPPAGGMPKKKSGSLTESCLEIGQFSFHDADIFEKKMALPPGMVKRMVVDTASSYMVYIPPLKDLKTVEKKMVQLREKGISNYFVIPEGKFRYAISLGIFKNEDSARKLVSELEKRGMGDVSIAGRGKVAQGIVFQVNNLDDHQLGQINDLLDTYPSEIARRNCLSSGEAIR